MPRAQDSRCRHHVATQTSPAAVQNRLTLATKARQHQNAANYGHSRRVRCVIWQQKRRLHLGLGATQHCQQQIRRMKSQIESLTHSLMRSARHRRRGHVRLRTNQSETAELDVIPAKFLESTSAKNSELQKVCCSDAYTRSD